MYTWRAQWFPLIVQWFHLCPSRHTLSILCPPLCPSTGADHCRANDIKFNWRSSIKLAIKTAWTQQIPARPTFYEPPPPLSPLYSVCSALNTTNHHCHLTGEQRSIFKVWIALHALHCRADHVPNLYLCSLLSRVMVMQNFGPDIRSYF